MSQGNTTSPADKGSANFVVERFSLRIRPLRSGEPMAEAGAGGGDGSKGSREGEGAAAKAGARPGGPAASVATTDVEAPNVLALTEQVEVSLSS